MEEIQSNVREFGSPLNRFGAYILDGLILLPFYIPIFFAGFLADDEGMSATGILITIIGFLGLAVFSIWNQMVRMGKTGQSLGKKWTNIAVLGPDGKPIGIGKAVLREIPGKILSALVCYIGFLNVLWDKDKQGWHDKIAGTYVYKVEDNFS